MCQPQDLTMASLAILYGVLAACSVDLAMGQPLPPVWVTPWHILDGSSYAAWTRLFPSTTLRAVKRSGSTSTSYQ